MADANSEHKDVIKALYDIEGVKFGEFTLKSGIKSPIYFDLRVVVSYPKLMARVSELMWKAVHKGGAEYSCVCGVPYTALPLATCMSTAHDIPMLVRRKEAKDYGTKKMIEGKFEEGQKCLIAEDVVTTGGSVLETMKTLNDVGIKVTDAVVLLNREQGGLERLQRNGIKLHCVFTVSEVLNVLQAEGCISADVVQSVHRFLADSMIKDVTTEPDSKRVKLPGDVADIKKVNMQHLSYAERAKLASNSISCKLWKIMAEKETNLAFSADVTKGAKLLELADTIGPHICILKTHVDILDDFSQDFVQKLKAIAKEHNFLIFEDRKFADIGNTVKHQYADGIYRIVEWADIINAHVIPGEGIIKGLKEAATGKDRGCVLIAQMSSKGNLATGDYTKENVSLAEKHNDFVMGFICIEAVSKDPKFVHMTPGVNLGTKGDNLGQQYNTPHDVIVSKGSDVIIVGRGIYEAEDPVEKAIEYKKAGFEAYLESLKL